MFYICSAATPWWLSEYQGFSTIIIIFDPPSFSTLRLYSINHILEIISIRDHPIPCSVFFLFFTCDYDHLLFSFSFWFTLVKFHPICCKLQAFIFPQRSPIVFHCVYITIFLFPLSVIGHIGSFQILAITNNALVNMGLYLFFHINVLMFGGKYPEME